MSTSSPRGHGTGASLLCLIVVIAGCKAERPEAGAARASGEASSSDQSTLDKAKQELIWSVEHGAFELEKKFGRSLTGALRSRDLPKIIQLCRPAFAARLPDPRRVVEHDRGFVKQMATAAGDLGALPKADAGGFASYLCDSMADFVQFDKFSCRVLDLRPEKGQPESGWWDATLYLAATGTDAQGVMLDYESQHTVRFFFLNDKDIEAGTILDRWQVDREEFRRCDRYLFEEVTQAYGLDQVDIPDNWKIAVDRVRQYVTQMAVADFDLDGFLDLAVASANGRWRLLRSIDGKRFEEVTAERGLPLWSEEEPRSRALEDQAFLASWIDFDNDGYPDLVLGDRLYHNHRGVRFEDVTDRSGLLFSYNPKGCVVADYNCDGRLDLYVLYQNTKQRDASLPTGWVGDDTSGAENHLWKNVGNGRFENVTDRSGAGGGRRQSFAAVWLHANEDHFPDLYVANDFGTNSLLLNQGNETFVDVANQVGVADYATSMGVAAGDLTGDGMSDIYVANMFSKMGRRIIAHISEEDYPAGVYSQIKGSCAGNRLYVWRGASEPYEEISEEAGINQVGWAYAPALADFDCDGWLDVYATTGFLSFHRDKPDG